MLAHSDPTVIVGTMVTTLDDNSFRWSPRVTVATLSEFDHGQYATIESTNSQTMLDALITLPVLPTRIERAVTVTVTDSGDNSVQCTASVYMRAPVLALRDATGGTVTTVEMTTLTTSSTRVFEMMLFNAGEVRLLTY